MIRLLVPTVLGCLLVQACGQTGPLYLPGDVAAPVEPAPADPTPDTEPDE